VFAALLERVPTTWAPAQGFLTNARSRITTDAISLADWLQRAGCGLEGHVMVLQLEPRKMSLRCMHCGQQTPGWSLDEQRY
jgi:hypothetical protein